MSRYPVPKNEQCIYMVMRSRNFVPQHAFVPHNCGRKATIQNHCMTHAIKRRNERLLENKMQEVSI